MKMLIASLLLCSSVMAFAGDRNTAYEAVCKNMSFESDRNKCVQVIRPFSYFDERALSICTIFPFDSTQMECLGYIGDKRYEMYEIDICQNATFDSEKLKCLKDNGSFGGQTCMPRQEVISQLRQAQLELRQGNTGTVDKRLTYLIGKLNSCNK